MRGGNVKVRVKVRVRVRVSKIGAVDEAETFKITYMRIWDCRRKKGDCVEEGRG